MTTISIMIRTKKNNNNNKKRKIFIIPHTHTHFSKCIYFSHSLSAEIGSQHFFLLFFFERVLSNCCFLLHLTTLADGDNKKEKISGLFLSRIFSLFYRIHFREFEQQTDKITLCVKREIICRENWNSIWWRKRKKVSEWETVDDDDDDFSRQEKVDDQTRINLKKKQKLKNFELQRRFMKKK